MTIHISALRKPFPVMATCRYILKLHSRQRQKSGQIITSCKRLSLQRKPVGKIQIRSELESFRAARPATRRSMLNAFILLTTETTQSSARHAVQRDSSEDELQPAGGLMIMSYRSVPSESPCYMTPSSSSLLLDPCLRILPLSFVLSSELIVF